MKKVLVSFANREHRKLLDISAPLFAEYATRHEYELWLPSVNDYSEPWLAKMEAIEGAFDDLEAGVVLWLDADVLILDMSRDVLMDSKQFSRTAFVVHQTKRHGEVPNTGVWLLDHRFGKDLVGDIIEDAEVIEHHPMHEQATLIRRMGADPNRYPIVLPTEQKTSFRWTELPYEYNVIDFDMRGIPENTRFFHATGTKDIDKRAQTMRDILRASGR